MQAIKRIISLGTTTVGSLPDIDEDFSSSGRDKMFDFLREKEKNVARVCNITFLKARGSIKAAARVLGKPPYIANQFTQMIDPLLPLEFSLQKEDVSKFIHSNGLEQVVRLATGFNGLASNFGIHAAAVVISSHDILNDCPLMKNVENPELPVTQYDMYGCEDVGLVKFDLLSISTLDVIQQTCNIAKITMDDIPLEDPGVYKLFSSGQDLFGIFQFEQQLTQRICVGAKPVCLEDLSAINAVIRPGALHSGFHKDYVKGSKVHSIPVLNEVLKETKGILLYQEQLMELSQKMAGLTAEQADDLRKGIGKKKKEVIMMYHETFVNGSTKNGYTTEEAEEVWGWFDASKDYAFNKSHSMCYSLLSYYCAWLRVYYPVEFFTAFLNAYLGNREKLINALRRIKKLGIKFLLPDINKSQSHFTVENNQIRFGLSAIKGLGEKTLLKTLTKRGDQQFISFQEFTESKIVTPSNMATMAKAGCFDSMIISRNVALEILNRKKNKNIETAVENEEDTEKGFMEKDLLGIFLTKNPLESISAFRNGKYTIVSDLGPADINRKITVCGVISQLQHKTSKGAVPKQYATCVVSDPYEELSGVVFPKNLPALSDKLQENVPLLITGYLNIDTWQNDDEEEYIEEIQPSDVFSKGKITIMEIVELEENTIKKLTINLPENITKERLQKLHGFLMGIVNDHGAEVSLRYNNQILNITPIKVMITEATEIYLRDNYNVKIERT